MNPYQDSLDMLANILIVGYAIAAISVLVWGFMVLFNIE